MTLEEALHYIHAVCWKGSIPGLARISALLDKMDHPERTLKFVHVTGTNGKGSTCAMVASVLRQAGYAPYYLYRQKYMSGSFENVGWSKSGAECWYNIDIMSELCSILSFGAGGSTKMVEPGTNHIERVFNLKYPKEYTERPEKCLANQAAFAAFYENLDL